MAGDPQNPPDDDAENEAREMKCENCNAPLDERTGARCDIEGLWFCNDCWQALAEDFDLVPKP